MTLRELGKYALTFILMALLIAPFCIWGAH